MLKQSEEELLEARALKVEIRPPVSPPPEKFIPEPPRGRLQALAGSLNDDLEAARAHVLRTAKSKLATISRINPVVTQEINTLAVEIEAKAIQFYSRIEVGFHEISEVESAIRARALTIVGLLGNQQILESAQATLNSKESLNLDEGKLLVLAQRVKHLPAVIQGEAATVKELEGKARQLAASLAISLAVVVEDLRRRGRDEFGRVLDSEILSCAAHLDIPNE